MKIAIVGSRNFPNLEAVREYVRNLADGTVVVSGGARGVDSVAVDEAHKTRGRIKTEVFPANWNRYGRQAGFIRNTQIVEASEQVVAFWDGHSRGTLNTIEQARRLGKLVTVIRP